MTGNRWAVRLIFLLLFSAALALGGCAAQQTSAGTADTATATFDHAAFDTLLQRYVDEKGLVDYAGLKKNDLPALRAYLDSLAQAAPDKFATREERLAFWLNAYNACTIAGVLERYPLASVRDDKDFFKTRDCTIGNKKYSLDEIENEVIRPTFKEPRIHFVLVCAAQSCPRLWPAAVQPETLEARLEKAAVEFINSPAGTRVDAARKRLQVSSIFKWYAADFEAHSGSIAAYVKNYLYAPPQGVADYEVSFLPYDWGLNEQPPADKQ